MTFCGDTETLLSNESSQSCGIKCAYESQNTRHSTKTRRQLIFFQALCLRWHSKPECTEGKHQNLWLMLYQLHFLHVFLIPECLLRSYHHFNYWILCVAKVCSISGQVIAHQAFFAVQKLLPCVFTEVNDMGKEVFFRILI